MRVIVVRIFPFQHIQTESTKNWRLYLLAKLLQSREQGFQYRYCFATSGPWLAGGPPRGCYRGYNYVKRNGKGAQAQAVETPCRS